MPLDNWFIVRTYKTAFILHDIILRDISQKYTLVCVIWKLSEGHLDQHFNWTKTPRHRERGRPWRIYQALPNEHTIKRDKIRTRGKKKKKGRGDGEWRQTKERKRKEKREKRKERGTVCGGQAPDYQPAQDARHT